MAYLLRVNGSSSDVCKPTSMTTEGLTETGDLESWIKAHPEVIDPALKVVTTQFSSWASKSDSARERPDVLALSTSGELVVVELKRDSDRRIHLQAITYGALVAGFTKDILVDAHAEWLKREGRLDVTQAEALQELEDHVEAEWTDDLFRLPRLVLIAESFPAQVLTTVQWLAAVAPDLTVECHEYQLFRQDAENIVASFRRLFPVDDLTDRHLRPIMSAGTTGVREQLATNNRRAKSVTIIHENNLIPEGANLTLELETLVKTDVAQTVRNWLLAETNRSVVTWAPHHVRPLKWAVEPDKEWTPTSLRDEIFERSGLTKPSFSAADAWCYNGTNLYYLANSLD